MSSTNQQFPEDQDQPLNDTTIVAQFAVSCDAEGRVSFDYDWDNSNEGTTGMSSILSVLDVVGLSESVLQDMKEKCNNQESVETVKNIEVLFTAIKSLKNQSVKNTTEQIVVDPIEVISLL
jgi:hypothetical protein